MIGPGEAWQRLEARLAAPSSESIARRHAAGRILAEPLTATCDLPPCDVSAMDGFALSGPLADGPLPVAATIAAGDGPGVELASGQAAAIMTGAPVPLGADRVVPIEQTDGGEERVAIEIDVAPGAHIRRQAEIVGTGDLLLRAGTRLSAAALSLAASHGHENLVVIRAPRVALLVTGDEVVTPTERPAPGQIRDSHSDFLTVALADLGIAVEHLGIVGDDRSRLEDRLAAGLEADVLLVTGGVSMGRYDYVEQVLSALGCDTIFDSVAIQPGKPLVAARHDAGLVFGLPGNPASVMVAYWLFVRPVLRRLLGSDDAYWHGALGARLTGDLPGTKGRARFLPGATRIVDGEIEVEPVTTKGSHDLAAYARGDALVLVPAHAAPATPGSEVEILPLVDWRTG